MLLYAFVLAACTSIMAVYTAAIVVVAVAALY
jgi:hypothetical protein